jgi:hypothetical protein
MNEKLFNALDICLQALENGETLDAALARFPEFQAELRPLLETSRHAQTLAAPAVPSDAQRRGRARLLQHAAEMREAKRAPKRTWLYNFRPLAVTLTILVIFLASTGLVRASSGALPGDNLYQVKRAWEGARLLTAFTHEAREALHLEYESERLHEVDELLVEGREEPVTFSGYVVTQDKSQWNVAGVPVRITDQTKISGAAIDIGAGVRITGQTDADGFLVAQSIQILPVGTIIPPIDDDSDGDEDGVDNDDDVNGPPARATETPLPVATATPFVTGTPSPTETVVPTETETENEEEKEKEKEKEKEEEEEEKENENEENEGEN